jgi:hypothetical protein
MLGGVWAAITAGNTGKNTNEFTPFFYRKDRFQLLKVCYFTFFKQGS